jgi:OHCU decarboxylase
LGSSKGRLAPGYRADLVAWNPDEAFSITPETIVYRHKITPYGGRPWTGVVHRTWLGGQAIWAEAGPVGTPRGRSLVRRTELDALPEAEARAALLRCCTSERWVGGVLIHRPFGDFRTLSRVAGEVWDSLDRNDRAQAFAGHPRIGNKDKTNREQAGLIGTSAATLDRLTEANEEYFRKFGFVFLVFATGRTADQMLALLEARLNRSPDEEWAEASAQHHKITLFRLAQLS